MDGVREQQAQIPEDGEKVEKGRRGQEMEGWFLPEMASTADFTWLLESLRLLESANFF